MEGQPDEIEVYEVRIPIDPYLQQMDQRFVNQLDSPISRMGGKSELKHWLVDRVPQHAVYVEPFMGSLQVLLAKRQRSKIEIVNDIDADMVSFFRFVQFAPRQLAKLINSTPTSEAIIRGFRLDLEDRKLKGIERAAAWYFHNCASVNATGSANNYASSPHSLLNTTVDEKHLIKVAERLRMVDIRNTTYRRIIESANKKLDDGREKVFFYLDPPYDETAGYSSLAEGSSTFGKAQQKDLRDLCVEIHKTGNLFIQTNSATEYLHKIYSEPGVFHITKRMVRYSVAANAESRGETAEFIISNFPLKSQSEISFGG